MKTTTSATYPAAAYVHVGDIKGPNTLGGPVWISVRVATADIGVVLSLDEAREVAAALLREADAAQRKAA